jgi:hypothetical protein
MIIATLNVICGCAGLRHQIPAGNSCDFPPMSFILLIAMVYLQVDQRLAPRWSLRCHVICGLIDYIACQKVLTMARFPGFVTALYACEGCDNR